MSRRPLRHGLSWPDLAGAGFASTASAATAAPDFLPLTAAPSFLARQGGNRSNICRDRLEARVLSALRHHLMEPALFKEFCDEFTREMNRLRMEGRASIKAAQAEVKRIDRELEKLMDLYLRDAMPIDMVKERSSKLESRKVELSRLLGGIDEPPPLLHPNMAHHYRFQIAELHDALQEESEAKRMAAADIIRSLVKDIILTPENGELQIDVRGDLAGILSVSLKKKGSSTGAGASQVETEERSHLRSWTQKDRPVRAGDLRELASQVEMVAGAGFEPATFRL